LKFDFFQERTPPLIGVDISSTAVKMVELSGSVGAYQLENYSIAPLVKDSVVDGHIASLEQVGVVLSRAWKLLGTRERRVALALPTTEVISKKVLMQAGLREHEMELQVETEASQYIPFALDDVNIDFQVLGPAPGDPSDVEVMIAASRKDNIEDRVGVVEEAGLKVVIMDVETYATEAAYELASNQLANGGRGQTVLIVDIGAVKMRVSALHDNQFIYSREQTFGGYQLTQEIQRQYGLTFENAEISKRKGDLPDGYKTAVLEPFKQSLVLEVARALQLFVSSSQYNKADHIMLAGGCAAIPGVDVAVAERTRVNTVVANPFVNMSVSSRVKQKNLAADAPSLMIACGLALRRFD
jgi:type IV pilus assembly protein PilM